MIQVAVLAGQMAARQRRDNLLGEPSYGPRESETA